MKKINNKGFTLIELLAVITIMGILMLVAIPAVSRTIENSRRDTFTDTAKAYLNAAKNAVAADEVSCKETATATENTIISALPNGDYYYTFSTADTAPTGAPAKTSATDLLEQGGKSSWGNADIGGYIKIHKTVNGSRTSYDYSIYMADKAGRGITTLTAEKDLGRAVVSTASDATKYSAAFTGAGGTSCIMNIG